eukprot:TRINITY_DN1475_c0_g1_i7.p1 TRINITY_DN1475_c0_g1~~TRINITY_DN1475_c0_g1_i7.p1  ORF type:complete len:345 (-),score=61.80 TRINITY_DN1475_c0_g1_i7:694-1728(-)
MVVFAVSIVTKTGKALVSRQFVEITRSRIEGLLAAFPKLIGTGSKEHTFIETENVRYLYQPLEELYMVLLTNKASNILEDLETLQVLTKVVPEYCRSANEKSISEKSFDLIFAFDEAIALGYKEKVNISHIKTFTKMESEEEKFAEMVERNKERETNEIAKRRYRELEKERREREKLGKPPMTGIGNFGRNAQPFIHNSPDFRKETQAPEKSSSFSSPKTQERKTPTGLQLKREVQKPNSLFEKLKAEGEVVDESPKQLRGQDTKKISTAPQQDIEIQVTEKLLLKADRDGTLHRMEVRGELVLAIAKEEYRQLFVQLEKADKTIQIKVRFRIIAYINLIVVLG